MKKTEAYMSNVPRQGKVRHFLDDIIFTVYNHLITVNPNSGKLEVKGLMACYFMDAFI
jgi:hypothetical protein